ncbi:NAD(P)H-binding protein [Streptomyces sp. NBS 14/10]|uniref:NAD(P)H-binding protein n=1 Tax=Streptomyces sp. NBS 14/10 TaxID=1945643 RepID=UPI000B7C632B|nr:NAD(P)H-binding protein [Streptomyces sp. NBS 14/10]KAK1185058.1 NAD(P)H-binding protein [Streptomyces sp. NBS 14/10]NUP43175.1 NAD(P)H-binding protein [Streptomyces sp.]NUS83517.1 NAD(P)H-binding protein [Streptomyces sp.]
MTTHSKQTILVLGATGKTGRRLVHTLRAAGRTVRAASRSGEIRFDWSDQDTWPPALEGVSAVYLMAPEDPAPAQIFVKQATEAGVGRFVALSGRGIDQVPADFFQGMAAAERAVRESGAQWTILRPNNFNQNFDDDAVWRAPLRDGRLALPMGSVPEPFIDAQDIADVAAAALTSDGHHGQVYDLSGPRALTFGTAVATIAEAAGRPIRYVELTPEEYRAELLAEGVSEEAAAELNALFAGMRAGHFAEPADGVRRVLGRDPVDFDTYATRAAAADAWS